MLYDDDTFTHKDHVFRFRTEHDSDSTPPWQRADGHGIITDWTTRSKAPGERVLIEDYNRRRYYDHAATLKIAIRDKWGTRDGRQPDETPRQYAARAVEEDYAYLRAWCWNEWTYIGVIVTFQDPPVVPLRQYTASLWGIESNSGEYLIEVARELAENLIAELAEDEARRCPTCHGRGKLKTKGDQIRAAAAAGHTPPVRKF